MSSTRETPWHRSRLAAVLGLTMLVLLAHGSTGASSVGASSMEASARWVWPLAPVPAVVRPFDGPPAPWMPGHRGVDLAAEPGQAVLAPAPGRVAFAGTVVDRGVLTIEHNGGLRTSYEPVTATVATGDAVAAGQAVAVVASQPVHCPPRTCLHWGLRRGGVYLDPLLQVRTPKPPVLLPWQGPVARGMTAIRSTSSTASMRTGSTRTPGADGMRCDTRLRGDCAR